MLWSLNCSALHQNVNQGGRPSKSTMSVWLMWPQPGMLADSDQCKRIWLNWSQYINYLYGQWPHQILISLILIHDWSGLNLECLQLADSWANYLHQTFNLIINIKHHMYCCPQKVQIIPTSLIHLWYVQCTFCILAVIMFWLQFHCHCCLLSIYSSLWTPVMNKWEKSWNHSRDSAVGKQIIELSDILLME